MCAVVAPTALVCERARVCCASRFFFQPPPLSKQVPSTCIVFSIWVPKRVPAGGAMCYVANTAGQRHALIHSDQLANRPFMILYVGRIMSELSPSLHQLKMGK